MSPIPALVLASLLALVPMTPAQASSRCAPADLGPLATGSVRINRVDIDLTRITYRRGSEPTPPHTARMGAISAQMQPLKAVAGSSLVVWRDRWLGCASPLNALAKHKPGFHFLITDEVGDVREYQIAEVITRSGSYPASWARLNGHRQVLFIAYDNRWVGGRRGWSSVVRAVPVHIPVLAVGAPS